MEATTDSRVTKESQSLLKGGHDVAVLDWDRSSKHDLVLSDICTPYGTIKRITFGYPAPFGAGPRKNFLSYWKFLTFARSYVKKHYQEYDVFHLCDLTVMYPLRKILLRRKRQVVYDIFDYFPDSRKWPNILRKILVKMETTCINSASAVIICSDERIKQIGDVKPKKLVIIHNSPDSVEFLPKLGITDKSRTKIAYVGYLDQTRFIDKIARIVDADPLLELHIGGSGPYEESLKLMSQKNQRIVFYGKMKYSDVLKLECSCDLLVALYDPQIPNNRFAAPNKFYESLALGKPLIMAKGTGFDDFFEKHDFGITVLPTEEGIRQGINQLILTKQKWPFFSKEEQSLYFECFAWGIMEKRLLQMYQELSIGK